MNYAKKDTEFYLFYVRNQYGGMQQVKVLQCAVAVRCLLFNIHRAVQRNIISIVKPTRYTSVSNLFYLE
jgi:hypothetical protein